MSLMNMTNVTNIVPVIVEANNETGMLLFGGISIMLFVILLVGFIPAGMKNSLLAASIISLFLSIFTYFLELIPLFLITFYIVMTSIAIIYRVFGGD